MSPATFEWFMYIAIFPNKSKTLKMFNIFKRIFFQIKCTNIKKNIGNLILLTRKNNLFLIFPHA